MSTTKVQAQALLNDGFTCVIYREEERYTSTERGVAPLLKWLESDKDFNEFWAADKVVGKAAAFLYVLLGVSFVHANVISDSAAEVFTRFGVGYSYGEKVSAIRNRAGDGFCPMEQAVWDIDNPQIAHVKIQERLRELKEQK